MITKKTMQLDHAVRPCSKTTPTPAVSAFDAFWKAYPKKRDKVDAQEVWRKISPAEIPAIMAGLESWKASDDWKREGGKYIPYAVRFLMKRRWEDELPGISAMSTAPRVPTATDCRPKER